MHSNGNILCCVSIHTSAACFAKIMVGVAYMPGRFALFDMIMQNLPDHPGELGAK